MQAGVAQGLLTTLGPTLTQSVNNCWQNASETSRRVGVAPMSDTTDKIPATIAMGVNMARRNSCSGSVYGLRGKSFENLSMEYLHWSSTLYDPQK